MGHQLPPCGADNEFNPFGIEGESPGNLLDAYFTQNDCAGFAYWFAEPLLDRLISC